MSVHYFTIAEHHIKLIFGEGSNNDERLLPSFASFEVDDDVPDDQLLFTLTVDDTLAPYPKDKRERIRVFDTGNGDTSVDKLDNGGYQYIIKDLKGADCCMLQTNESFNDCRCALNGSYNMRCFGLNNALMLIYAFAGSKQQTLLTHASLVRHNGYGYAFIAKSGTGKSTQVSLWLRHIEGCDLMNDDNPIIRIIDGSAYIYGSPWSGKTPCYRNIKAKLGAITRIDRAKENSVERLPSVQAFASLLPACSSMKWDSPIFGHMCATITKVIEQTPIYTLHCLPDKESAVLCHKTIAR